MWLPIFDDGANIRFAARPGTSAVPNSRGATADRLTCSTPPTRSPGGTPICCSPSRTGCASRADTTCRRTANWIPVVTFLQVSADMAVAIDVPDGHGHRYVRDVVNAWAAVLQPPGWTADKTESSAGSSRPRSSQASSASTPASDSA